MGSAAPSAAAPAPAQVSPDTSPTTSPAAASPAAAPPAPRSTGVRLPGVVPDDDPGDFPSPPATSPSGSSATPRGPDGKFVKADAAPSPRVEGHPEGPDTAAPKPARFKFAGEEYDSQEAAEQNVKSLRGQFKPLQEKAAKAAAHEARLVEAAHSARSWKGEFDRVNAELIALKSGKVPAGDGQAQDDAADEGADVDWELYAEIKRLAVESGEPWKAEKWLIDETRKVEQKRVNTLLDQRLAPLRQAEARQAVAAQTETLFGTLADYVTSDGNPAFPELHEETSAFEIGKVWAGMGLPPDFAMTTQGAIAAIGLYRMMKGSQGRQAGAGTVAPTPPAPSTPTPQALAAATVDGGRPAADGSLPGDGVSTEASRILAGLKQAHMSGRGQWTSLGFEA